MNSKKFHFVSAALVTVFGSLAAFHWADVVNPATAAYIVTGLGAAKALFTLLDGDPANDGSA